MADWRITEDNPVREDLQGFDYERCAALHNLIVERGWTQRGFDPAQLDRRTWWECYDGDGALLNCVDRLESSLMSFFKLAWQGFSRKNPNHAVHRILYGLSAPEQLFDNALYNEYEDDGNKSQFLTLYGSHYELAYGHVLGLIVDQENFSAMQHISMEDSDITMNGRQHWIRLEEVLEALLQMMDQGKVMVVDDTYTGRHEKINVWIMRSYTELDLEESLEAFDELVAAIEERLPAPLPKADFETGISYVYTSEGSAKLPPDTFARRFLELARKPRFKFLAPGLQLASFQPFASTPIDEDRLRPVLLLQSSSLAHDDTFTTSWGEPYSVSSFQRDFQGITEYPAGLYLTETKPYDVNPFEDGCRLILPFRIGENCWARTGNEALFGEDKHAPGQVAVSTPTSTELFQQGYNYFINRHNTQLKFILLRWTDMVESGKWEVDQDGVKGGIEKWREADTEEHWQDY